MVGIAGLAEIPAPARLEPLFPHARSAFDPQHRMAVVARVDTFTRFEHVIAANHRRVVPVLRTVAPWRQGQIAEYFENAASHRTRQQRPVFNRRRGHEDVAWLHVPVADQALSL